MSINRIYFTLLLTLLALAGFAQPFPAALTIGSTAKTPAEVLSMAIAPDGSYIIAGTCRDSLRFPKAQYAAPGLNYFITKMDAEGNISWTRFIQMSDSAAFSPVVTDAAGDIYLMAHAKGKVIHNGTIYNLTGFSYFITKLDASGGWSWFKVIGCGTDGFFRPSFLRMHNNELIAAFQVRDYVTFGMSLYRAQSFGALTGVLARIDMMGDLIGYTTMHGTGNVTITATPEPLVDGSWAVACSLYVADTFIVGTQEFHGPGKTKSGDYIMKMNGSLDSVIAYKFLNQGTPLTIGAMVTHMRHDDSGGVFIAGRFRDSAKMGSTLFRSMQPKGSSGMNCYLMSLNKDWQLGWMRRIGSTTFSSDECLGIGMDSLDRLYFAGSSYDHVNFEQTKIEFGQKTEDAYVMQIDGKGNLLQTRKTYVKSPGFFEYVIPQTMTVAANGVALVGGRFWGKIAVGGKDTLASKGGRSRLNDHGFVWTANFNYPESVASIKMLDCKVYPNPVDKVLNWASEAAHLSLSLTNMAGQTVYSAVEPGIGSIDVSSLPKGLYLMKMTAGDTAKSQLVMVGAH